MIRAAPRRRGAAHNRSTSTSTPLPTEPDQQEIALNGPGTNTVQRRNPGCPARRPARRRPPRPRHAEQVRHSHRRARCRAAALLRRWAAQAEADPAAHTYFPSLARAFFRILADEARREKRQGARDTERRKSYEVQPIGIPESLPTTLDPEDSYTVFRVVLEVVKGWESDDDVLPNEAAHRHLIQACEALAIMARAQLVEMGPLVQAHLDDDRAAQEWRHDRWMARGRLERADQAARRADAPAQERQRGNKGANAGDKAATTPAAPATAHDERSA